MAYIDTKYIRADLAAHAASFEYASQVWAEHVAAYDAPDLISALNDLLILTAKRVALIVPGQERYTGPAAPGLPMLRYRYATFSVILAIRDEDGIPATVPNSASTSEQNEIIDVKDLFIAGLPGPSSHAGTCLYPLDGGPQDIRDSEDPDRRLWRAWIVRLESPAGAVEYDNETF